MGKAVGLLTAGLGTYMTFKMWAEFQDALGTVFGASWGIIIATVVFPAIVIITSLPRVF